MPKERSAGFVDELGDFIRSPFGVLILLFIAVMAVWIFLLLSGRV